MRREYRGAAAPSVLTTALVASSANLIINCYNLTNWPTGASGRPFYVVIDRGLANEEKILCSSRSGNTISVYNSGGLNGRAADETSISAHSINAVIEHVFVAVDADEANQHVNTGDIHLNASRYGITICTSATRPSTPGTNEIIFETDTYNMRSWSGSQWIDITGGETLNPFFLMGA
jgi:hypothetical protein